MIPRLIGLILIGAGALSAAPNFPLVNSPTPLSLDSLIALGYRYNPGLQQVQQDVRLNPIGKLNAVGQFLPSASLGAAFSESHFSTATFTNPDGTVSSEGTTGS